MQSCFKNASKKVKCTFLTIGFVLLLITIFFGYRNAMEGSSDLMWYPTKLLWSGVNPYSEFLSKGLKDWQSFSVPNYAPLLYVVLYPLSLLDFEGAKNVWFFLSVLSLLGIIVLSHKKLRVPLWMVFLILTLLLLNNPVITVFNIAQNSLVVSFILCLAWAYRKHSLLLIATLSLLFVKYSFGLPIILGFFLAGYRKEAFYAVGINMLVYFLFAQYFNISFLQALLLPLRVAQANTLHFLGDTDLMSLAYYMTSKPIADLIIPICLLVVFSVFVYLCYKFKPAEERIVSASVLLSLVCFFHLNYDSVILIVPLFILCGAFGKINPLLLIISCLIWLPGSILRILKLFLKSDISSYLIHEYRFGTFYGIMVILLSLYFVVTLLLSNTQDRQIAVKT